MKNRRNTVNFLQIENGLREALELCHTESQSPWATSYQERLETAQRALEGATEKTDATYLAWRAEMKTRLLAAKHLWQAFERIRDELGEYGVDAEPSGRYNYWEPEIIDAGAAELIGFLAGLDADEVFEAPEWKTELSQGLEALRDAMAREQKALERYQRIAPRRRQAIYHALAVIDEFHDIRGDYRG